jgi:hypothetical protein
MGEIRNAHKTVFGKHEDKRSDGRPRFIWEIKLKWILQRV